MRCAGEVVEEEVGGGRSSARRSVSVAYCQRRGHAVLADPVVAAGWRQRAAQ